MSKASRRFGARRFLLACIALPAASYSVLSAAQPCELDTYPPRSPSQKARDAYAHIRIAAAIIDGEVVRPWTEARPALVRAERVFKGRRQALFEIGVKTSCDIGLKRKGTRMRMILTGGPGLYFLTGGTYPKYEDRLLGSDRRKAWPYREGLR